MTIKQLIFCVESNKQSKTDWIYIRETINRFFEISNEIKLSPIFTGSKMNIKSSKTKKEITKLEKAFKGKTIVICCIDADEKDSNPEYKMEFENLRHFCKENEYEFVWFNKDIEDVYLGHQVHDTDKVNEARRFRKKKMIDGDEEDEADSYAKDALVPKEKYEEFISQNSVFNKNNIIEFADSIDRDPGIVLGRLQNDGLVPHTNTHLSNALRHRYNVLIS